MFWVSKLIGLLLHPLLWVFLPVLTVPFVADYRKAFRRLMCSLVLLWLISNPYLSNWAIKAWEYKPTPMAEVGSFNLAIICGGFNDLERLPKDRAYLGAGADRAMHTVKLYKEGKIQQIMVTGGNPLDAEPEGMGYDTEAEAIKQVLLMCGVPDSVILIENKSKNTYENAKFSKEILKGKIKEGELVLLVSSAYHLRRARLCFEAQGFKVEPFAVDFKSDPIEKFNPLKIILPSKDGIMRFELILHEVFGIVAYRIFGYA